MSLGRAAGGLAVPGRAAAWAGLAGRALRDETRAAGVRIAGGAVLAGLAACGSGDGPQLISAVPSPAHRDAMVTLTGARLCGASGDCNTAAGEVDLGRNPPLVRAVVVDYSDTSARIVVPSLAPVGMTVLTVTVDEQASNALDFEVLP